MHTTTILNGTKTTVRKPVKTHDVLMTYDYAMFKKLKDNRDENLLHIKRLVNSFNEQHLVTPIIVNQNMQIIDGQHRLAAAIETGKPVYYIVVNGYGINEVTRLNTNQKNWTKIDYLNMYVAEGYKNYIELNKFMSEFPDFGIQSAERLITLRAGNSMSKRNFDGKTINMKDFEEGKLVIPNVTLSYILARKIMDFKPFYKNYHRGTFVSSIMPLLQNKLYSHKEMIEKLKVSPIQLRNCQTVEAYRMLIEDIYNWKRQKENKVSFRHL